MTKSPNILDKAEVLIRDDGGHWLTIPERVSVLAQATQPQAPAAPDERDIEIAGLSASVGHLSALVDSQHALLEKAKATMAALHSTVSPVNESHGDLDARIPASAFARFVEAHAELLDAMAQSPVAAPAAPAVDASDDKALLDFLRDSSCDLRSIDVPTGGDDSDVHWRVIEHYMSEPREREIGRSWTDNPREAIRAAIAAKAAAKKGGAA